MEAAGIEPAAYGIEYRVPRFAPVRSRSPRRTSLRRLSFSVFRLAPVALINVAASTLPCRRTVSRIACWSGECSADARSPPSPCSA